LKQTGESFVEIINRSTKENPPSIKNACGNLHGSKIYKHDDLKLIAYQGKVK
jgi:hypothetical protein